MNASIKHLAIIIDGHDAWAKKQKLTLEASYHAGLMALRHIILLCVQKKIATLSLFATPENSILVSGETIYSLNEFFLLMIDLDLKWLKKSAIQLHFFGDFSTLSQTLQKKIIFLNKTMKKYAGLQLLIAINYDGKKDLLQAIQALSLQIMTKKLQSAAINAQLIENNLLLKNSCMPDLLIRTGNTDCLHHLLLWHIAYTELYFAKIEWPAFTVEHFLNAIDFYAKRERRFGYISEQLKGLKIHA